MSERVVILRKNEVIRKLYDHSTCLSFSEESLESSDVGFPILIVTLSPKLLNYTVYNKGNGGLGTRSLSGYSVPRHFTFHRMVFSRDWLHEIFHKITVMHWILKGMKALGGRRKGQRGGLWMWWMWKVIMKRRNISIKIGKIKILKKTRN